MFDAGRTISPAIVSNVGRRNVQNELVTPTVRRRTNTVGVDDVRRVLALSINVHVINENVRAFTVVKRTIIFVSL